MSVRYVECMFYISGDYTDKQTFVNDIDSSLSLQGWNTSNLPYSVYKNFDLSTTDISIRQELYNAINPNYISGLNIQATISDNVLQWS